MSRSPKFDKSKVKVEPDDRDQRKSSRRRSLSPKNKEKRNGSRDLSPPRSYKRPNAPKTEPSSPQRRRRREEAETEDDGRRKYSPPRRDDRRRDFGEDRRRDFGDDRRRDADRRRSPPRRRHDDDQVDNRRGRNYDRRERENDRREENERRERDDGYGIRYREEAKPRPQDEAEREDNKKRKLEDLRKKGTLESEKFDWGKQEDEPPEAEEENAPKDKPNFALSGKLAADTNTFNGVVIKYNEPPEARKPKLRWRLYPFKGDEALEVLYIHRQSAYLIGRDRKVADIPVDHPSCSKQHAAFQYRAVPVSLTDGRKVSRIRPYIIDLGSANGTFLNNNRIDASRYYELREKDVLKFGFSSREYVLLNENSQNIPDSPPPSPTEEKPTNEEDTQPMQNEDTQPSE